jgi:hypothetical protein
MKKEFSGEDIERRMRELNMPRKYTRKDRRNAGDILTKMNACCAKLGREYLLFISKEKDAAKQTEKLTSLDGKWKRWLKENPILDYNAYQNLLLKRIHDLGTAYKQSAGK